MIILLIDNIPVWITLLQDFADPLELARFGFKGFYLLQWNH